MSMSKYITDTRIAAQLNVHKEMKNVVSYLAANRSVIEDGYNLSSIFSARSLSSTPMSQIFSTCVVNRHLNEFATIANPSQSVIANIPDLLTMSSMVVDLKQYHTESLSSYRELYNKMVLNITHLVKVNRTTGALETNALHELHSMYVKAMLVRSYFDSGNNAWLSPIMRAYIVRTYALFISSVISRVNQLSVAEFNDVGHVLALYMHQMLAGTSEDIHCPNGYLNITYLGQRHDLIYTADKCKDIAKNGMDLNSLCTVLSEIGPAKLKNYNLTLFLKQCVSLGISNDTLSSYMSFDYPPYWVWLILTSISGVRLSLMSKMLQQFNMKQAGTKFVTDLIAFDHRPR